MMESVGSNNIIHHSKNSSIAGESTDLNKFKSKVEFPEDAPPKFVSTYDSQKSPLYSR
jgi:hypothetical protein